MVAFYVIGAVGSAVLCAAVALWWRSGASIIRRHRKLAAVVLVVSALASVGLTVASARATIAYNNEVAREQAKRVEYLAPVVSQLEYLGFEAPEGTTLSDPTLYHFMEGNFNIGKVRLRSATGVMWIGFERYESHTEVGCFDGKEFLIVYPYTARLMRQTSGCPNT